jgi:hypothetical protein
VGGGITIANGNLTLTSGSEVIGGTIRPTGGIRDSTGPSGSLGTAGQILSSNGAGIVWITSPTTQFYRTLTNAALTNNPSTVVLNTGSVTTLLSKAVTITASLYFNSLAPVVATTITVALFGGSTGATPLLSQQIVLPLIGASVTASIPISWVDTTAGTNIYRINASFVGGPTVIPQILAGSNMIVANAQ